MPPKTNPSLPHLHAYYSGRIQPASGSTFQSINPATATPLATIHSATPADIDAAIVSAKTAFPSWSQTPAPQRATILLKAAALLRARNDALAKTETLDTGKPFTETSTVDVVTGADVLEFFAHLVASGGLNGETTRLRPDAWVYSSKEPLGVCVGIGAWNYPLQIALWKSGPCLAAGNCMVYKPSEVTPLHALALAQIYTEAGVPDGVFNVVLGGAEVGRHLTAHRDVAKVSFTGQVATGRKVAAAAAAGMKYVTMELGGKSACLVLPDADLAQAVDGAMMANFFSSGQVCTNGTRVFVPAARKREFEQVLLHKLRSGCVRAGDVMDPATNFGPLVSEAHFDKVRAYVRHGIEVDGATVLAGGLDRPGPPSLPQAYEKGYWLEPTVFTDCRDDMKIVREEIFGPVMCILAYDNVDEAVRRANATDLGLAAGVFGKDLSLAHGVVARLEAGITWINTWGESPAEMSVGGWKQSGVGVENGRRGIEAWVRNKSTLVEMGGAVPTVFAKL